VKLVTSIKGSSTQRNIKSNTYVGKGHWENKPMGVVASYYGQGPK